MTTEVDNYLAHYGVKGMRWGKRSSSGGSSTSKPSRRAVRAEKREARDATIKDARDNLDNEARNYNSAKKNYNAAFTQATTKEGKAAADKVLMEANDKYVSTFNTAMLSTSKERQTQMIAAVALTAVTVGLSVASSKV